MDLKTAFLQGEAYDETRDIICQIPPGYGYPPYIGARLKKPGYGLNDTPRRWWQIIVDLFPYAQICTYVLYNSTSRTKTYQPPRSVSTEQVTISEAIDHLIDPVGIFWEKLSAGLKVPKFKRTLRARAKFRKSIFKFN